MLNRITMAMRKAAKQSARQVIAHSTTMRTTNNKVVATARHALMALGLTAIATTTGDDLVAALEASLEGNGKRPAKAAGASKSKPSADGPKAATKPRTAAKTKRKRKQPKTEKKGGD